MPNAVPENATRVSIFLPNTLATKTRVRAAELNLSQTKLIRQVLEDYFAKSPKKRENQ